MKLEVGMYVRTKNGNIGKITFISSLDGLINLDTESYSIGKHFIEKASHNIIDLIEEGDYVNGELVLEKVLYGNNAGVKVFGDIYYSEDIKSIVTKEQFESMKYSLEG